MSGRGRYNGNMTDEVRKQYIIDCRVLSVNELALKYKLSIRGASARRRRLCGSVLYCNKVRAGENNPMFGRRSLSWVNKSILKKLKRIYGTNINIARALSVSIITLNKAMDEHRVWYKGGRTIGTKIPKELLEKLYGKGFDLKKISSLLDINASAIARTFHQYGLKYNASRGWKRSSVIIQSSGLSSLRREATFKWEEGQRARIRARDGYACFLCSKKEDGKAHHVHHILWDIAYSEDRHLATLCHNCHAKTNRVSLIVRALWIYFFTKRLSEAYGYVYDDMIEGGERVGKVIASAD
jgi:AraC-like DNA-binding protein